MKLRTTSLIVAALVLLPAASSFAQGKFAYVDMQRALEQIDEGKAIKAQLKGEFEKKQSELDKKQEELKKEYASITALAREGVLKDDKLRQKEAELEAKLKAVTQYWQESQKDLGEKERAVTQQLFGKMSSIVQGIAESEGFTFVFDRAVLAYAPDSLDITNELVRKYNAKFPAKGGAAVKSDAPKKPSDKK
jgi:outer membrane protein